MDADLREDRADMGTICWCSSPRPDSSPDSANLIPCFAVGSSKGLLTISASDQTTANSGIRYRIKGAVVQAVDWLSHDVIIAGTRASQVHLYDMRSDGSTVRVRHPHAVHSVKKVDDYRIAVAGWGNNVYSPLASRLPDINMAQSQPN